MKICLAVLPFLLLLSAASAEWGREESCPCDKPELCEPIDSTPDNEVVGFIVNNDQRHWMRYNWTYLTTIMMFTELPTELLCYAHSLGVRVVLGGLNGFGVANLTNATARTNWIKDQLYLVQRSFADGINLDIEEAVANGSTEQKLLTEFVGEVYTAFKSANQNYQVTYDVAWSPNCTDGRCYEVAKFADSVDFLIVMSYDEQSQIYGQCVAMANSPLSKTQQGLKQYLDLGIKASKLVLGQPWYGYDYPCVSMDPGDVCHIKPVSYQGAPCSDAAGKQLDYGFIRSLIDGANIEVKWNSTYQAPYFEHVFGTVTHQIWFDDPHSLSLKFSMAKSLALKGLAFWNIDSLQYIQEPVAMGYTAAMWTAIDSFFV